MSKEQVTALRNLLTAVIPKEKLAPGEIDALVPESQGMDS